MKSNRIFLMLLALNVAAGVDAIQADELNRYLDEVSTAQIGTDNLNTVPAEVGTSRVAQRLLTMFGGQWLKSWSGTKAVAEDAQEVSLADALRASEYDVRMNDEDVMLSLTYRF